MRLVHPLLALLVVATPLAARDWFVRAGATGGDGSREKPFADPWEALAKCEAGDAIHVAEGEYLGRLGEGSWEIPFDRVQLYGGYDEKFEKRDPWYNLTLLEWKPGKNRPTQPRLHSNALEVVIDGFFLDSQKQNNYEDDLRSSRSDKIGMQSIRLTKPGTVRNCVVMNPGRDGIHVTPGSTVENCVILNAIDVALDVASGSGEWERVPAKVHGNTILFTWDDSSPGKGGGNGTGIRLRGPADVKGNLIAFCDNNAIDCTARPERVSITGNAFFMNLWSNLRIAAQGNQVAIDDKTMETLEEVGLKACDGNAIVDPRLELDSRWIDLYSQRTARQPGKLEMDDWNELRRIMGLPLIGTAGEGPKNFAPAWPLDPALALLTPGNAALKAGARKRELKVAWSAANAGGATKSYAPATLLEWIQAPGSLDGKPIEMVVAIGPVTNPQPVEKLYPRDQHAAIYVYDPTGQGKSVLAVYRKGTNVERTVDENTGRYRGQGLPDRVFKARGVAHALPHIPKAAIFIESIERHEELGPTAERPAGRDWFVREGASGGDGSKEKPFRDPWQALERCEAGDTIHVAGGEYVGKLKAGKWQIDCPWVAMLGGYDETFQTRDPWKRPTRLFCPPDFKGRRGGITFEGIEDHTGFVLDGFVFDKSGENVYQDNRDLDRDRSDKTPHVSLTRPDCQVRNCVFVNGAYTALVVANGMVVENNIILNHTTFAVDVRSGWTPRPLLFRNNTVAFSWDLKFGKGHGAAGALIRLGGNVHAVLQGNVFEFADNDAVKCDAQPADVELRENVFAHNLWSNVASQNKVVDDQTFAQLEAVGFKACSGNQVLVPGLPLPQEWFDVYVNRTAYVPGKVTMDDWNRLRDLLGQPLIATGGKPGTGFAPAFPLEQALELFPGEARCKAGARPVKLEVKLTGITREEPAHEYAPTGWDVAKDRSAWDALDGKRVELTLGIYGVDGNMLLADAPKEQYESWRGGPPEGMDGLPLRLYVKRGTRHERAARLGSTDLRARPEATFVVRGIAKTNRQLLVESIEPQ